MKKDQHVNSSMSKESNACMELYVRNAKDKQVDEITIVDEFNPTSLEPLNIEEYYFEYLRFVHNEITPINLGLEVVLSKDHEKKIREALSSCKLDLIVGSTDPASLSVSSKDICKEYLETVLANVRKYRNDIDVVRSQIDSFKASDGSGVLLSKYQDLIDEILRALISNNIGIEVNSSSFGALIPYSTPSIQILKRYKELGGSIITVGSYASTVEDLSLYFENVYKVLEELGFDSISQFHKRTPEQIELTRFKVIG